MGKDTREVSASRKWPEQKTRSKRGCEFFSSKNEIKKTDSERTVRVKLAEVEVIARHKQALYTAWKEDRIGRLRKVWSIMSIFKKCCGQTT